MKTEIYPNYAGSKTMNWQPIDTAPMDGTRVLLYLDSEDTAIGSYNNAFDGDRWEDDGLESCPFIGTPTHWMPLPPPPTEDDTFTAHGLTWRKHTPGDPRPCDAKAIVRVLCRGDSSRDCLTEAQEAHIWIWKPISNCRASEIIGWNYAD